MRTIDWASCKTISSAVTCFGVVLYKWKILNVRRAKSAREKKMQLKIVPKMAVCVWKSYYLQSFTTSILASRWENCRALRNEKRSTLRVQNPRRLLYCTVFCGKEPLFEFFSQLKQCSSLLFVDRELLNVLCQNFLTITNIIVA